MNEIKRRLMNGYVEMQDGTFAKEVNGELIPVHEDEATAHEPEMFLDDDIEVTEEMLWEKVKAGTVTKTECEQLANGELKRWKRIFKAMPTRTVMKMCKELQGYGDESVVDILAKVVIEKMRDDLRGVDVGALFSKVLNGDAMTPEESEKWMFYQTLSNIDAYVTEARYGDEDMAYWYERGCPVDDCPGFRGD